MKKRMISLMLALCMIFTLLPFPTYAQSLRNQMIDQEITKSNTVFLQANSELGLIVGNLAENRVLNQNEANIDEKEPNDDFANACLLESDLTAHGALAVNDIDCFTFKLSTASEVRIVAMCTTADTLMAVLD